MAPALGAGRTGGGSGCVQFPQPTGADCPDAHARAHPEASPGPRDRRPRVTGPPGSGPAAVSERAKSTHEGCVGQDSPPRALPRQSAPPRPAPGRRSSTGGLRPAVSTGRRWALAPRRLPAQARRHAARRPAAVLAAGPRCSRPAAPVPAASAEETGAGRRLAAAPGARGGARLRPARTPAGAPATAGSTCWARPAQAVRAALPGTVSLRRPIAGRGVVVVDHGETRTTYEPVLATVHRRRRRRRRRGASAT